MIVVTIELWPHGDSKRKQLLGCGAIANDGSGSNSTGNYNFELSDRSGKLWKSGEIKGFPRKRLLGWDLLFRILRQAVGERNA